MMASEFSADRTHAMTSAHARATALARRTGHEVAILAAGEVVEWVSPYIVIHPIVTAPSSIDWNGF